MQARTGISERRACQLIGLSRSVLCYQPRASVQSGGITTHTDRTARLAISPRQNLLQVGELASSS